MAVTINADTSNGLVMTPDTSGEIKLQSAGADIATVTSSGITMASGKTLPAEALTGTLPAGMGGKILQVVSTTKTDTYTQNSNTFTDVTGLSVSITPASTSSKILILAVINGFAVGSYNFQGRLMRDSTAICIGDAASNRPRSSFQTMAYSNEHNEQIPIMHLDSPSSTSSVTYKIQVKSGSFIAINRTEIDRDTSNFDARMASSITVMEIAG